jgi:hypothetical protein
MRLRLIALIAVCSLVLACESDPTAVDTTSTFVETHRGILAGSVTGAVDQPLEDVEVVVRFAGSDLPAPSTRTDGAGGFEFVLAMYNNQTAGADSAKATVYAIARNPDGTVYAITHKPAMIQFRPVADSLPTTTLSFSLPIL